MSKSITAHNAAIDAQRVNLMLNELRLPAIKLIWADFAARADKEGWPGARLIAALAEQGACWMTLERASQLSDDPTVTPPPMAA
jgi:hypothetical protein